MGSWFLLGVLAHFYRGINFVRVYIGVVLCINITHYPVSILVAEYAELSAFKPLSVHSSPPPPPSVILIVYITRGPSCTT